MPRRLRVLMLGPGLGVRGGVSAVERHILASLPADIEIRHIATMQDGSGARKIAVFGLALLRTLAALVTWRPDIAHLHFSIRASTTRKMILARLCALAGTRIVLHAHGAEYPSFLASMPVPARAATVATLRAAHGLIALSRSWKTYYESLGLAAGRVVALPNPIVRPPQVPARAGRQGVTFLFLGIMDRRKGALDLVEAVDRVPKAERERLRWVMAGDGPVEEIRALVRRHGLGGCVTVSDWVGPVERDRLLEQADVYVLPSHDEGLPMGMLEAMSWGLAVIVTPVGGVPEIVRHGVNGVITPAADPERLAVAMSQLARDPETRARLGAAARESVAPLDARLYGQALAALYHSIDTHGRPPAGSP